MKQVHCPFITNGLHFFDDHVRVCCSNATGPILIDNYKGEKINWIELINKRLELKEKFINGELDEICKNCFEIKNFQANPPSTTNMLIETMYISHWLHCNCSCYYCVNRVQTKGKFNSRIRPSKNYNFLPILKDMINAGALSKKATVYITGGEPTVLKEFEKVLELLTKHLTTQVYVFTSGIRFSKSIYNALKENKCNIILSIDSGSKETYKKIKRVDGFEDVKKTLRKYIKSSVTAKNNITFKYILLKDMNDNIEEVEKWLLLAKDLNIKKVQLDIEYSQSTNETQDRTIPEQYYRIYEYVKNRSKELDLEQTTTEMIKSFLDKGYVF